MTVIVANTLLTSTFDYWRNRTNELATAMSNVVVTVGSNAAVGDAQIVGTLIVNNLSVGNTSTNTVANTSTVKISNSTSNLTISIPTVNQIANGNYVLNANSSWMYLPTSNAVTNSTGISSIKVVDSFVKTQYAVADYIINVSDNNANAFHTTRLFVTHDNSNTNAYITEYAVITSNTTAGVLGVFSANANSTHVKLNFVPNVTNTTIKVIRTIV